MNDNTAQPRWKREFPDFDGMDFDLPEGFEDTSSRDVGMPTFVNEELGLTLFVDHADPALRECRDGKRFGLFEEEDERCGSADPLIADSDEFEDIRIAVEACRAQVSPGLGYP